MWNCKKVQGFLYSASFFLVVISAFSHAAAMNDYPLSKDVVVALDSENAHKKIPKNVTGVGYIDKARTYIENSFVTKLAVLEVS